MEHREEFIEQVEAWLNGSMDIKERTAFQNKMNADSEFKSEVQLVRDIITGIELSGEERIRTKVKEVEIDLTKQEFFKNEDKTITMNTQGKKSRFNWMSIAAAFVFLAAAAYFMIPNSGSVEEPDLGAAFAQYFKPDTKALPGILDKLEASGFANPEKDRETALAKALKVYESNNYTNARESLADYLEAYPGDQVAELYMGLTQIHINNYAEAIKYLDSLASDELFEQQDMAKWYLALCMTQTETKSGVDKAKELLTSLAQDMGSIYQQDAKGFLTFLE